MCDCKQGYKLADGTYSSEYKIGDKFEVVGYEVSGKHKNPSYNVGQVVVLEYNDKSSCPKFTSLNGGDAYYEEWACLKSYKESKQFTKSDLLDGMLVVYRSGYLRIVFADGLYELLRGDLVHQLDLIEYRDDLTVYGSSNSWDIMKVTDRDGTVLFTREETPAKSPAQIELDKLQEQIAQLQEQANKLQQSL